MSEFRPPKPTRPSWRVPAYFVIGELVLALVAVLPPLIVGATGIALILGIIVGLPLVGWLLWMSWNELRTMWIKVKLYDRVYGALAEEQQRVARVAEILTACAAYPDSITSILYVMKRPKIEDEQLLVSIESDLGLIPMVGAPLTVVDPEHGTWYGNLEATERITAAGHCLARVVDGTPVFIGYLRQCAQTGEVLRQDSVAIHVIRREQKEVAP